MRFSICLPSSSSLSGNGWAIFCKRLAEFLANLLLCTAKPCLLSQGTVARAAHGGTMLEQTVTPYSFLSSLYVRHSTDVCPLTCRRATSFSRRLRTTMESGFRTPFPRRTRGSVSLADLNPRKEQGSDNSHMVRCPYCVEDGNFKAMSRNDRGDSFACQRCGHLTLITNPDFECTCAKCIGLRNSQGW
jgi:hypothetical protein